MLERIHKLEEHHTLKSDKYSILSKLIANLTNYNLGQDKRIEKLEEHHTRQIDENRNVDRRIDKLAESLQMVSKNSGEFCHHLDKKIENLESINSGVPTIAKYPLKDKSTCRHQWDNTRLQTCPPTRTCVICGFAQEWIGDEIRKIKPECEHDFGCSLLLSDPPKQKCDKCGMLFEVEFEAPSNHPRDMLKLCEHGQLLRHGCLTCTQIKESKNEA